MFFSITDEEEQIFKMYSFFNYSLRELNGADEKEETSKKKIDSALIPPKKRVSYDWNSKTCKCYR